MMLMIGGRFLLLDELFDSMLTRNFDRALFNYQDCCQKGIDFQSVVGKFGVMVLDESFNEAKSPVVSKNLMPTYPVSPTSQIVIFNTGNRLHPFQPDV
jgi:hypothetical protein